MTATQNATEICGEKALRDVWRKKIANYFWSNPREELNISQELWNQKVLQAFLGMFTGRSRQPFFQMPKIIKKVNWRDKF